MNIPAELRYSKDHEWIKVIEGGEALVGITDFAQGELGDIVFVDVPTVGETIGAHEVFGSIEAVKTVSDVFLPVSGEILKLNPEVDADPALVNKEPYEGGWLVRIRMENPDELEDLLTAEGYAAML
jgi:glycine cleavage system H protein